jgi:hypothetical protein
MIRTPESQRLFFSDCKRRRHHADLLLSDHRQGVHSGINASEADVRRLSALRLSLWCPYCQCGHAILGKDMQVGTDIVRRRLSDHIDRNGESGPLLLI